MSPARTPFENRIERYGRWVVKRRWVVAIASVLAVVGLAMGAANLGLSSNYRVFFSPDNPDLAAFEAVQNIYTKNDNILFVVTPAGGDVFTNQTLSAIEELTEEAWQIPYSIRVDSVTNFQHSVGIEDDLIVEDLVSGAASYSDSELEHAREVALARPELLNRLISSDSAVTGVNVTLQLPGETEEELPASVGHARDIIERLEAAHPHLEFRLTGLSMLNSTFVESGMRDMKTVIPLMFLVLIVAITLLVRSVSGTLTTLGVISLSSAAAMGVAGWFATVFGNGQLLLSPVALQAPTMILTMAIADSIHVLVTMQSEIRNGLDKQDAIVESLRVNFVPVMLTSLTTAIGFLSMNFSDSPPLHHLGNITAAGVTVAFLLSVTFLPAAMSILPVKARRRADTASSGRSWGAFDTLGDFVVARRKPLLWVTAGLVLALAIAVPTNRTADEYVKYFDESIPFRTDTEYTMAHLTGIYTYQMSIESGEPGGISDPAFLGILDEFAQWLRQQEGVVQVSTLTDTMRRLNMNLHGDDPAYYRIPESRDLAAQYLLLFEMSLPYGLDLNNQINVDKSSTRIVVTTGDMQTDDFLALAERSEDWLKYNGPYGMNAKATGPSVMFSRITQRNLQAMVLGTLLAFVLISGVLAISLKDIKIGLLSLVPNIVPALMAFGAWGLTVGKVGFSVSVVAAMTMGIVVDDTVHFLSKYLRARREKGLAAPDAVRYAFSTVGRALWVTSAVLVAGFLVLAQSTFKQNADMGLLAAITILFALVADFFLLPQLLMLIDGRERVVSATRGRTAPMQPQPAYVKADRHPNQPRRNPMKRFTLVLALAVLALGGIASANNNTVDPEARGLEIAVERDARDIGFHDFEADLRMTLQNRHGETSERSLRSRTLEQESDGDKSLIIFDAPADIDGTAFLTFSHKTGDDDQWLYLPALKRVKRISSSNKSGPFVGSEFAYEDISSQEVEEYTYKYVGEDEIDGRAMHIIEQYPVDPKSGYTRQVAWVDQEELRNFRIDFYDRKDSLLKTLTYEGYEQYLESYWRPARMTMVNHQTGKSTVLHWEHYEFQVGLDESDFNRATLARAK